MRFLFPGDVRHPPICRNPIRLFRFEFGKFFFEFGDPVNETSDLAGQGVALEEFGIGFRRRAEDGDSRRKTLLNGGSSRHTGPVAKSDVPVDAGLRRDDDAAAEFGASRDPALTDQYRGFADNDIVGNMNQIVDLDPFLDPGPAESGAVNGAVGADFDIVVDLHDAVLPKPSAPMTVPE